MGTVTTGSFDEIQDDLGGANPISLSEYYRESSGGSGSTTVPNTANNSGVPKSGAISVADLSSVDGGTGANDDAYNAGGTTSASTSTANKTGCSLSTSYTFACSASTSWTVADGDGNTPSNATITWSGSGISFSGSGASVTATVTSSGSYNTTSNFTATATGNGGTTASFSFSVQTLHDTTVNDLGSASDSNVEKSTTQYGTSNIVSRLTTSVTASHSGNGDFSVTSSSSPGGTFNTSNKSISNGNYIHTRQTASSSYSTATTGSVTAGGDTFTHTVTTRAQDTTPTTTSMPADYSATGVALSSSHTTGSYTLGGVDSETVATMTSGGTNGINMSDSSLTNGETCTFSQTASSSPRTTFTGTATVSGLSGMSDTTHSYSIRTGDNGVVETGNTDYTPTYKATGGCSSIICAKAALVEITRTFKVAYSSSSGYIALYLYDEIDDYTEYMTGDSNSNGYVWHTTYYTGSDYSAISGSDQFKIVWVDRYQSGLNGMFTSQSAVHSSFGGSTSDNGNIRTYTSNNMTLSSFPNSTGTATDVMSRTGERFARCECEACMNTSLSSHSYSAYLVDVSGTHILGTAPTTGTMYYQSNASTTWTGNGEQCF